MLRKMNSVREPQASPSPKEGNYVIGFILFLFIAPILLLAMTYWLLWDLKEYVRKTLRRIRPVVEQEATESEKCPLNTHVGTDSSRG